MATSITQENSPQLWSSLYAIWVEERKPGWVVYGGHHYQVHNSSDTGVQFYSINNEDMINSTSRMPK
jgi:hypothetical protein